MPTIYQRITEFNKGRIPAILQRKYKIMALNVFSFYRGTCHLFYEDLSKAKPLPASPLTWVCGDLHLENFGSFKGDDRQEYFDLNDFDEAMLAPALWEVTRMAASIFVAFDSLGLKPEDADKTAQLFLDTYSHALSKGKALIIDPRTASGVVREFLEAVKKRKQKELLKLLAIGKKGKFTELLTDERHLQLDKNLREALINFITNLITKGDLLNANYKVLDCVFRLAGTGSLGINRYLFLLERTDVKVKYLFLDMKQALTSSLKPYIAIKQPGFESEGERVIAIQQRMQNVAPALLRSIHFKNEPYVLKQMQPIADKINFAELNGECEDIDKIVADMATLTASAQLRSTGRQGSAIADDLIAFGSNQQWHKAVFAYSRKYAAQAKKDYNEFLAELAKQANSGQGLS